MRRIAAVSAMLVLLVMLLAACGTPEVAEPPEKVTVQLRWVHQAQFAGFYLAQKRGYYAEENLAVILVEGGPDIGVAEQVVTGQADFGVSAPEETLVYRSQGKPVVAIAVIYRRSPVVFVALADSGIERPADLRSRTVALEGVLEYELQFEAMMKGLGFDINQVETVPYSYDYSPFYNREVDATAAYSTGGLIRMRQAGYHVKLIWPSDFGLHFYADTLITSDQMIAERPELVTRFLRATLRGWRDAIEDPEEAVTATLEYALEADVDLQTQMTDAMVPLVFTGQDDIGWMQAEVWEGMYDVLLEQGLLDEPLDVHQAYTMRFLQEIYGGER